MANQPKTSDESLEPYCEDNQPKTFGDWIERYCEDNKLSHARFAQKAGVAPATVKYWISGERKPLPSNIQHVAERLRLNATEKARLYSIAGIASDEPQKAADSLYDKLRFIAEHKDFKLSDKVQLLQSVSERIMQFHDEMKKKIHVAVIPIAGWQKQILSPEVTAQLLNHAMQEARQANIRRVVVVVDAEQERMLRVTETYHEMNLVDHVHLDFAVQDKTRRGPGHAVLIGAAHGDCLSKKEPFAVIFPDEFTKEWCLNSMIAHYEKNKKHTVVALQRMSQVRVGRVHGVAYRENIHGRQTEKLIRIQKLVENPKKIERSGCEAFRVFGRYIITHELAEALRKQARAQEGKELFLTGALNILAQQHGVLGFLVGDEMQPIRSLRADMEASLDKLKVALEKRLISSRTPP